jgi:hypothetical protein
MHLNNSKFSIHQTPSLIWVVDQDQFNPDAGYEEYVFRVPNDPQLVVTCGMFTENRRYIH